MFYFRYAWRNIRRGGQWTALAIFCIVAGVATVVALRGLGLAIADSLIENVRIDNKGDIRLVKGNVSQFGAFFGDSDLAFSEREIGDIGSYLEGLGAQWTAFANGGALQIAGVDAQTFGRPSLITTYYIDPYTYPSAYQIVAQDPPNAPLSTLFDVPNAIVISRNMADAQGLKVGDTVRVQGTDLPFTITGIVRTEEEAGIRNLFGAFFGFAYISLETAQRDIHPDLLPNNIAVTFPQPLNETDEYTIVQALNPLATQDSYWFETDTARDLLRRNEVISRILGDFIVVMGLGALLIGGVGIMNTMLVMVRRRTNDIASLKTFGLKGRQIALLFFTEGILLGILGSLLGSVAGVLLGGLVNAYGEAFLQQRLAWKIYPEALVYGFVLGIVTTAIFSLAPILTALQVRPATILRPNETVIPRLGCFQTILLMVVVVISIGLVVGRIVAPTFGLAERLDPSAPYISGVISVAVTLSILGVLVALMWVIVWLVGKFPTFGNVHLRLALRNMSVQRTRTATTLLALSAGMFALSVITFVGEGTRELLSLQLSQQLGGNILAFPIAPGDLGQSVAQFALDNALNGVEGVKSRTTLSAYEARMISVDGRSVEDIENAWDFDAPLANGTFDPVGARFIWSGFNVWDTTNPTLYEGVITIVEGRNLTLEDRGKPVIVGPQDSAQALGIQVGSTVVYRIEGRNVPFEVVGLTASLSNNLLSGVRTIVPPDIMGSSSFFTFYVFDVAPEGVNQALVNLSAIRIPPTFAIDITFIDSLISRIITQFSALPTIVGLLSLASAAVIMANTVALATLERRRQVGVLKAVGLKNQRVLLIMLIESTLIGLLSAGIGIGLSAIGVGVMTGITGTAIPLPTNARLTALALLISAIGIGWFATFLSANVALRERVMNVLRYE